MFWGIVIEPGKKYTQIVETPFQVTMASLDVKTGTENEISTVVINLGDGDFILCNLSLRHGILQQSLCIDVDAGSEVTFEVRGKAKVHLTGCTADEDLDEDEFDEEDDDDEEEDSQVLLKKTKKMLDAIGDGKRKASEEGRQPALKKAKPEMDVDDDDDEDESLDEEEDLEDEESSVEEEEKEEEPVVVAPAQSKKNKNKTVNANANNKNAEAQSKADKKKKNKKNKGKNDEDAHTDGLKTLAKRFIHGGVQVEDLSVGNGAVAKPGKMVTVYYTGRLKKNNKQFDQTRSGPGFKFRLGSSEVIKGWDVGVAGMKVGGKRRLVIPPKMGYGQEGAAPAIPPNSALVFEVELRAVN